MKRSFRENRSNRCWVDRRKEEAQILSFMRFVIRWSEANRFPFHGTYAMAICSRKSVLHIYQHWHRLGTLSADVDSS